MEHSALSNPAAYSIVVDRSSLSSSNVHGEPLTATRQNDSRIHHLSSLLTNVMEEIDGY